MLRRYRGIKPTHLWHLTSIKDFKYVLNRRLTAREKFEQRERKDFTQLVAIVIASSLGILYTYGQICSENPCTSILPPPCKPKDPEKPAAAKKECPKVEKSTPCPPKNDNENVKPCSKS